VLTFPYSETFYNSKEFRDRILCTIENPRLQLDLIFNKFSPHPGNTKNSVRPKTVRIELKRVNNMRKLSLRSPGFPITCSITPFPNLDVGEISLTGIKVKDLKSFSNVKNVSFSADRSMHGVKIDLAPLQHLEKGFFTVTKCVNHAKLANLQSLAISNCESITNVSCFANIPVLDLHGCDKIKDVSPLSRVHTLDLNSCEGIKNVSSLKNVHKLILDFCDNVKDISGLENVSWLSFRMFQGKNVSGLKNVVFLDIADAENVTSVSALPALRELNISGCQKLKDLTALPNLKELTISNENKITSVKEILQQLVKLDMTFQLFGDNDSNTVPGPKEIKPWENFDMLTTLPNLKHLVVTGFNVLAETPDTWKSSNFTNRLVISAVHWKNVSREL
jgi:hypothetical protein